MRFPALSLDYPLNAIPAKNDPVLAVAGDFAGVAVAGFAVVRFGGALNHS